METCITCKRIKRISYRSPPTMSLPDFRVNEERPFKYMGINYCGPVYINTASHTKKNYIDLSTCAAIRMIHLELVRFISNITCSIFEEIRIHLELVRFISNITCSIFEEIRRKKRIAKINVTR